MKFEFDFNLKTCAKIAERLDEQHPQAEALAEVLKAAAEQDRSDLQGYAATEALCTLIDNWIDAGQDSPSKHVSAYYHDVDEVIARLQDALEMMPRPAEKHYNGGTFLKDCRSWDFVARSDNHGFMANRTLMASIKGDDVVIADGYSSSPGLYFTRGGKLGFLTELYYGMCSTSALKIERDDVGTGLPQTFEALDVFMYHPESDKLDPYPLFDDDVSDLIGDLKLDSETYDKVLTSYVKKQIEVYSEHD